MRHRGPLVSFPRLAVSSLCLPAKGALLVGKVKAGPVLAGLFNDHNAAVDRHVVRRSHGERYKLGDEGQNRRERRKARASMRETGERAPV